MNYLAPEAQQTFAPNFGSLPNRHSYPYPPYPAGYMPNEINSPYGGGNYGGEMYNPGFT